MKKTISNRLLELEAEHQIKILYACESGSRAWGFASTNSDYDVRFIYVHNLDWYLSIYDRGNTIELPIRDNLDFGGWEIKKALGLLWKSNSPLLEWLHSPIVYKSDPIYLAKLQEIGQQCFSPMASMHHYLNMSRKYCEACLDSKEVKLKSYLYALRTVTACKWIQEKGCIPPVEMPKLLEVVDSEVSERVLELIAIKTGKSESDLHPSDPVVNEFLKKALAQNTNLANNLPSSNGKNIEVLNEFYRKVVKGELV